MQTILSGLLWLYAHDIKHGLGGFGPITAWSVLFLALLLPVLLWERKLVRQGMSEHEANQKGVLPGTLAFVIASLIGMFFFMNG